MARLDKEKQIMKITQLDILNGIKKPSSTLNKKKGFTIRNCDHCEKEYYADNRNLKRGWGKCCSKKCAAKKREMSKPSYNPLRVQRNNIRRQEWNTNHFGEKLQGYTTEGYRIYNGVAYDEFDQPVYDVGIGTYDEGDSEYWGHKDF